ncbi:MAG: PqqD family protein [Bacteroidales bacterium]|nr:PqqD family protein [Bacteroidales bacterium]
MKTKKGFTLRTIGREYVLVAEGLEATDFNKMISMNETAAYLWQEVEEKDFDAETLADLLVDAYGVARETAKNDVNALLLTWKRAGIIVD